MDAPRPGSPEEIVFRFAAFRSRTNALWAIGVRMRDAVRQDVERAIVWLTVWLHAHDAQAMREICIAGSHHGWA